MEATILPTSIRRLLHDLKELRASPVSVNINAAPLEWNIYEWHGNLRHPTSTIFHFVLRFSPRYPAVPPSLLLGTRLPHANVLRAVAGWKVCLDMLDENSSKAEYKGWSQSYTVRSILMQLEAFLVDEASYSDAAGSWEQVGREARVFQCEGCRSRAVDVWPAWVTQAEVDQTPVRDFRRPMVNKRKEEQFEKHPEKRLPIQTADWAAVTRKKVLVAKKPAFEEKPQPPRSKKALPQRVSELQNLAVAAPSHARPASVVSPSSVTTFGGDSTKAGMFSNLPYEMVLRILLSGDLTAKDVVNLSRTCRHLHSLCMDGYFWKSFFKRRYPHSEIRGSSLDDWMVAFAQESNFASWELKCYASKLTIDEDVLGLPIDFTVNPKTRRIDYISVVDSSDFLSRTAFNEGVRRTVWNQEFKTWCPMYLSEEHFKRALPDLKVFMVKMCPQWESSFQPAMVLEVIPKMMNTLVVLLMDHGVSASIKALEGYFLLHRLLVGFLTEFPQLQRLIDDRFKRFVSSEDCRTKQAEPSLGDLLPLLAVSEKWSWMSPGLSKAVLGEFFDRQVIWTCKKYPELAKASKSPDVLAKWYEAGQVSRRLVVFHVRLLHLLRRTGSIDDLQISSDMLYGRPPRHITDLFQRTVKKIMTGLPKWPDFFTAIFTTVPDKATLTALLQQSVRNSLRKHYHTVGMDFSKIHSSGVSRILLKGQSYSAPPDLKRVSMKESWRWTANHVQYLDASCSIYDFSNGHLKNVYWADTSAFYDETSDRYAVRHSGDIIDAQLKHGEHTIELDMKLLSENKAVKALVFCMSGYCGATLQDFRDPEVGLTSPDHGDVNLCEYKFESSSAAGSMTSVVMCVLWRREPSVRAKWEVKAIGELGSSAIQSQKLEKMMKQVVTVL